MFSSFDEPTRQMLIGNASLIICCIFYLAWWLIAFHPTHGIRGFSSGWLLIPAFIFGILAVVEIVRGLAGTPSVADGASGGAADDTSGAVSELIPRAAIIIGGIVVYVVLLLVSNFLLKRQVTAELFLIVGWVVVMFLELCALNVLGHFSTTTTIVLLVVTVVVAIASLVCYLLYYDLNAVVGYIDGLIPLLVIGIMMAVVTGMVAVR